MAHLTSLERVHATIRHTIPDRVPVALHNFLAAAQFAGLPLDLGLRDGELLAEAQLVTWREFQHDVLFVENGVIAEAGACGCGIEFFVDGPPRVAEHRLASDMAKVAELEVPDPETTFPMCEVIKAVRILSHEIGDRVFVMGRADQGPVALAAALRGYEQIMIDLALNEQPDVLHQLLDFCVRVQTRYAQALRDAGAHGTATGGAGIDFIGVRLHRAFEHAYEKRFVEATNRPDFPVSLHICGDATAILEDMIATGAPVLELDYKTDMVRAKQATQGRATIIGPVNPALIWGAKDPAEVDAAAREAIEVLGPGGGFILGPGCALGSTTPPDNIHALVAAAAKYGTYTPSGMLA